MDIRKDVHSDPNKYMIDLSAVEKEKMEFVLSKAREFLGGLNTPINSDSFKQTCEYLQLCIKELDPYGKKFKQCP